MATLNLKGQMTVAAFKQQFNEIFGSTIRVYQGGRVAEDAVTLSSLGLKADSEFECRSSLTVGSFIERMMSECGLKVKVYTCDGWVAVLDGLTLESSGKVKKNAVKADMESMIAYQREWGASEADYSVVKNADGSYTVTINGTVQDNAKGAMRQIADAIGFEYDSAWTTQQFGAKLSKALNGETVAGKPAEPAPKIDNSAAEAEKARLAAEQAKAEAAQAAALAAAQAAADKAKAESDAQAAKIAAEKAAAEKAKAELEKQKAEAEAAKAELAKIQAEAAKAKAEAEAAKAAAEKAAADAVKAAEEKAKAETTKASAGTAANNKGVLPGLFSVAANKKVHFSKGNLQFNPKKYEWRFAEHQYDFIGADNSKIAANYDGWLDLFGYGTSGYMGCEPTEQSTDVKQYPAQNIDNTNYDWAVYNPISNGGNKEGLWRTLTKDEWAYLIGGRANAAKLRMQATVNNVCGLMLLPDDFYEHRVRVAIDATPNGYAGNTFDSTKWAVLEEAGVVFLPAGGYRYEGNKISAAGSYGYYWSSTFDRGDGGAWSLYFGSGNVITYRYCRYIGRSVRPVSESK